ncbi:hypothetical protein COD70_26250 [Bacillus cereus]|nr:hypothetical protein COD70_26250 [Bacillus cereus]
MEIMEENDLKNELNILSQNEWADETPNDAEIFRDKDKKIEELYPKGGSGEKGAAGEAYVHAIISDPDQVGWIFRKQYEGDYGIDAHFEIKNKGRATGRLIAAQIKYGPSYVTEHKDHYVFYGKYKHLHYWLTHSLPVVIVYVATKRINEMLIPHFYWVEVKKEKIKTLKSTWKIKIPKSQTFAKSCIKDLANIAPGKSINDLRLTALKLQRPLMEHLYHGGKIAIKITNNKEPQVLIEEKDNSISSELPWNNMFPIEFSRNTSEDSPLPWAFLNIDEKNTIIGQDSDIKSEEAEYKLYLDLNSFGHQFLNISTYLAQGHSYIKYDEVPSKK